MSKRPSSGSEGQATPGPGPGGDLNAAPGVDGVPPAGIIVSWHEARLRQTLPRVIGRCMSYSAATCFDEALVEAVRTFYGIEVDVATAETEILEDDFERVRFFPWFLWDFTPTAKSIESADLRAVGERFLADGELTDVEREIVQALTCSTVTFVEVVAAHADLGALVLRDLRFGDEFLVRDAALSAELEAGQVSLLRLVHLPEAALAHDIAALDDEHPRSFAMLDAIYAVLPPEAGPMIEAELARLCDPIRRRTESIETERRETMRLFKRAAPELLDFAEHVLHKLTEPPTLVNRDAQPIVLCRTFIGGEPLPGADAVLAAAGFVREEARWVLDDGDRVVGWLRPHGSGWAIESGSRERFERLREVLTRLGARLPSLHSEEELARAVAQWLALGECDSWLSDPEIEDAFRGQLGESLSAWPDQPHPALGRRTPREVKGEPGGDAVVQRLVQRVRQVAGEAAGQQLSTLLA